RADDVVEIVGNPSRKLADGFKLLRLAKLTFHASQLSDVLCSQLYALRLTRKREAARVQAHAEDSAVATPPLRFRTYDWTGVTAIGHQLDELFGETKYVAAQIQIRERVRRFNSQDGQESGIRVQKAAVQSGTADSVHRVCHQVAVARFGTA